MPTKPEADDQDAPEPTEDEKGRPFITTEAMSKHSTRQDCWMSVHAVVYNVSAYLEDHPGGEEVLLDRGGKDATEEFEDVGHSNEARKALKPYEIGMLPPSEREAKSTSEGAGGGGGAILALPVLLVAIGAGYYFYSTQQQVGV